MFIAEEADRDLLAQLRVYYIDRAVRPTFQSVILAGVYDVKNLKRKIRPDEEHKVNSPWNTRVGNESSESEQYVIEMKIWWGNEYNMRGEEQLNGYPDDYHKNKGYMVSFNFNKKKQIGVRELVIGEKTLIEAVV